MAADQVNMSIFWRHNNPLLQRLVDSLVYGWLSFELRIYEVRF